jgi:hypothetical protein
MKSKRISLRLESAIDKKIRAEAKKENRSVSNYIVSVLKKVLRVGE